MHRCEPEECPTTRSAKKTLLIKVAPDLSTDELDAIVDTAMACGIDGIVATNTTLNRPNQEHTSTSNKVVVRVHLFASKARI